jgi:hypothetical protein
LATRKQRGYEELVANTDILNQGSLEVRLSMAELRLSRLQSAMHMCALRFSGAHQPLEIGKPPANWNIIVMALRLPSAAEATNRLVAAKLWTL